MESPNHTTRLDDDDLVEVPDVYADFFEILRCGVCCHFDTSWKKLPCSHIYCASCIGKILETPLRFCPECRTTFRKRSVTTDREKNKIMATLAVKCTRRGGTTDAAGRVASIAGRVTWTTVSFSL
eukprot:Rmarinus@m.21395